MDWFLSAERSSTIEVIDAMRTIERFRWRSRSIALSYLPASRHRQRTTESRLDINEYLARNPVSTFFFPVQGDSMEGAEIFDGDILVVDKSVRPRHGHIVVAFVDGLRLVKRLYRRDGRMALEAENPKYQSLAITEEMGCVIWGVVVGKFKRMPT